MMHLALGYIFTAYDTYHWSGVGVNKVSFYYAVLLFYVVVYASTHAVFALFVAHFSFKDVNI